VERIDRERESREQYGTAPLVVPFKGSVSLLNADLTKSTILSVDSSEQAAFHQQERGRYGQRKNTWTTFESQLRNIAVKSEN